MTSPPPKRTKDPKSNQNWVWTVLPLNAGLQGFGTMVPLYILYLGGTVVQVALFTTLYNVVLIPASIFWGRETDRQAKRRLFFIVTCAGTTVVFGAMFLLPNLTDLAILYAALGLVIGANSVSSNLLVMETSEKRNWMSSYANLSLVSTVGSMIGLAVGFVWTDTLPLGAFLVFCAATTASSIILSYYLIPEPEVPLEAGHLALGLSSYPSRIYHSVTGFAHYLVISRAMAKDVVRLIRATRAGAITGRVLLFFSTFLFWTSTGFLNTSFTPFLVASGVTDSEVFAIYLFNILVQMGMYRGMGGLVSRLGGARVGPNALLLRILLYIVLAVAALGLRSTDLFILTSIMFALVGVAYTLWNSSTSVILFSNLGQGRQGNLLGGYAALNAIGTVAGSLFTGYISFYEGYSTTFMVAAALMLCAFFVLEAALRNLGYVGRDEKPPRPAKAT